MLSHNKADWVVDRAGRTNVCYEVYMNKSPATILCLRSFRPGYRSHLLLSLPTSISLSGVQLHAQRGSGPIISLPLASEEWSRCRCPEWLALKALVISDRISSLEIFMGMLFSLVGFLRIVHQLDSADTAEAELI